MIGAVIANRYELVRAIGHGGMGEVFEALDRQTRRRVAIKRLDITGDAQAEATARFRRELLATAQLATRHVVGVHDGGLDDEGRAYMVMDLLVGEDLQHVLERTRTLPWEVVVRIVSQACAGLAVAHGAGIVHRDIKPSNLFLVQPNERGHRVLKILDFGVARLAPAALADGLTEITRTGTLIGSPQYMAPEQLRGMKRLDHRADLWSLGVLAYRTISGELPHTAETLGDLILQVCGTPAQPLHQRAPQVPRELSDLVGRLLAIDPAARVSTAAELAGALARWLPEGNELEDRMLEPRSSPSVPPPKPASPTAESPAAGPRSPSMLAQTQPSVVVRTPVPAPVRLPLPTTPEPQRSGSVWKFVVLLGLIAVLVVVGERALDAYRRSREVPEPEIGPPPDLMAELPMDLSSTEGAKWFAKVRGRCNSIELRSVLAGLPPPSGDNGEAFAAACAAIAGDLDLARTKIAATADPAYASWPTFAVAHPLADQRNDDPAVANIMRLVLEFWPDNYLASYHAGITEFLRRDPRAENHLRGFLQRYPNEDQFKTTARKLLAELVTPGDPSCDRVVVIDPEGNRIHPPGCAP